MGQGLQGAQRKLPQCPKELTDWPLTVINTEDSSGLIRMGACMETPGHLHS